MPALLLTVTILAGAIGPAPAAADNAEARELLDEALKLARTVPAGPGRSDAIGLVAAEYARIDPKHARDLVGDEMVTAMQSEALGRAAEGLAAGNQFLGLATIIRIGDRAAALRSLARILATETLVDFENAIDLIDQIEHLTVKRIVQQEISRMVWADHAEAPQTEIDTSLRWAETIDDPITRDTALAYAAEGAAHFDLELATSITRELPEGDALDLAWRLIVQAVAPTDVSTALELLPRVEGALHRNLAAAAVVAELTRADRGADAARLAAGVREDALESIPHLIDRGAILSMVVEGVVDHDPALALSILSDVWPSSRRYVVQARIAQSPAHSDDARRRELLEDSWVEVRRIDAPLIRAEVAAAAIATAGIIAPELLDKWRAEEPELVGSTLPEAVDGLIASRPDAALELTAGIDDAQAQAWARARVAMALALSDAAAAREIGDALEMPAAKSAVLVALAGAAMEPAIVD